MSFLSAYLLFILKALTGFIFIVLLLVLFIGMLSRNKKSKPDGDELEVTYLNSKLEDDKIELEAEILDKADKKKLRKSPAKPEKGNPRLFVIDFDGDIHASETYFLSRQITAIINTADKEKDKVLLRLESPGGVVHGYGLASSQLMRLNDADINLTIAVDKVAASGGYMMACVADEIIAAPFAILGSIGVVAQVPNIHRLLKEKNVDIELHTAGEYKRTLTTMGENTDEGREKFKEELQITHDLFKAHISKNRPSINIDEVATGETWYGQQAIANNLADKIMTSDDIILEATKTMDVYEISVEQPASFVDKIRDKFMKKTKAEMNTKYFM